MMNNSNSVSVGLEENKPVLSLRSVKYSITDSSGAEIATLEEVGNDNWELSISTTLTSEQISVLASQLQHEFGVFLTGTYSPPQPLPYLPYPTTPPAIPYSEQRHTQDTTTAGTFTKCQADDFKVDPYA